MGGDPATVDTGKMRCKASVLRGYLAVLESESLLEAVRQRSSPATRAAIDDPPPASNWMPSAPAEEISVIVADIDGFERCRKISHTAAREGVVPLLRKAVEGFLRLFGATPATLLSRMDLLTRSTMEGIEYEWQSTDDHTGFITLRYPFRRHMPLATFHAAAGSLTVTFDLCGKRGSIGEPEPLDVIEGNAVRFPVKWA